MARKDPSSPGTLTQLRMAWTQSRVLDPRLTLLTVGFGLVGFAVPFTILLLTGHPILAPVTGVLVGVLTALSVFGRRAASVQLAAIEGQPGAAAAVVQSLRGVWRMTPAVAVTRKQDMVHRVVGRPGIVLLGEGSSARVAQLLAQERRRVGRVAGDIAVHEINVGQGANQVALGDLRAALTKLPRSIKPREIGALERKLSSLGEQTIPVPKGPMATGRPPKRMR